MAIKDDKVVDTEASEEDLKPTPGDNPRNAALDAISARRAVQINASLEEAGSDQRVDIAGKSEEPELKEPEIVSGEAEPTPIVEGVAAESGEAVGGEPETLPPEATPEPKAGNLISIEREDGTIIQVPASSIRTKVKVDGEESEITLDELTKTHQKSVAGAKRLGEAAQLKRDLEIKLQNKEQPSPDVVSPAPSPTDVQQKVEKAVEALYSGDVEEAKAALTGLVSAPEAAPAPATNMPSVDDLAADVEERLDTRSAGRMFAKDYADIAEDRHLMGKADAFADEIAIENPGMTKGEIFQAAGERTRQWIAGFAPQTEEITPEPAHKTTPALDMTTRREKKSKTVRSIPTSGKVAGLGEPDKPRPTHSDVIGDIKRARGQP